MMPIEPVWIISARKEIGVREIHGTQHNAAIVGYWKDVHLSGVKDDETAWCAAFVGAMLERNGITSTRSGAARSYLSWGTPLNGPVPGCIVVFSREGGGHVGFVVGRDKLGHLQVLGGNQGDCVCIAAFKTDRIAGLRWPAGIPVPSDPLPVLAGADLSRSEA
jgi:uncharacterized protein (TIGR02594 family)